MVSGPTAVKRGRTVMACNTCHTRKVRCNLQIAGPPCVNCELDGIACIPYVPQRKRDQKHKINQNKRVFRTEARSSTVARTGSTDPPHPNTNEESPGTREASEGNSDPISSITVVPSVQSGGNKPELRGNSEGGNKASPLPNSHTSVIPYFVGE